MAIAGIIYICLFIFSTIFALASFLLGGGHEVDTDVGAEVDVQVDHDIGGHLPSFFSPRVLALFVVGFSGMGIIAHFGWRMEPARSSLLGLAGGFVMGGLAYGLILLLYREQASSAPAGSDYSGLAGRVSVGIPQGGTGEVSVVVRDQFRSLMAVSADGKPIPEGRSVKIISVAGGTATVREFHEK